MLLYEMVIAAGIALVLVVSAIGGLVARVMMGPEEMALLREARWDPYRPALRSFMATTLLCSKQKSPGRAPRTLYRSLED